jgi:peptidoglycan hydrolase-like protein with peptidoglycan-binding domain
VFSSRVGVVARVAGAFALIVGLLVSAAPALGANRLGARTLKPGMRGTDVRQLQRELSLAGFPTPADGIFGPSTTRHVRGFEKDYDMRVNGHVDAAFLHQLALVIATGAGQVGAATVGSGGAGLGGRSRKKKVVIRAPTGADPTAATDPITAPVVQDGGSQHLGERTLKLGMKGHDVRVLQSYLSLAGYDTTVDGSFGASTKASVIAFEAANNVSADGIFTYADSLLLRQIVAQAMTGGSVQKARINRDGTATAPSSAPVIVQEVIAAANRIIDKPYIYAGGHGRWNDKGYDCSGSVSYALHGGNLLTASEDSTELESYGSPGPGRWITVYADAAHTWVVVAGIAFDTADFGGPNIPSGTGPRWRSNPTGNLADGGHYIVRHPTGL